MGQQCVITQMGVTRVSVSKVIQEMASNAQVMLVKYLILILYYFLALPNTALLKNRLSTKRPLTQLLVQITNGVGAMR